MGQIIDIAKVMRSKSMSRTLKGTVKEILGTAGSIGCSVEGQSPYDVIEKIDAGEIHVPDN